MQSADGQYGYDRPWQLFSETLASERMMSDGPVWHPLIESPMPPMLWQDADAWIRTYGVPPRYGWRSQQLTIDDVLDNVFSRLQGTDLQSTHSDDFRGVQAGPESSMRPTGAGGMAVT